MKNIGATIVLGAYTLIPLILGIGWCMNVYKLMANNDFEAPYKSEAIRVISVIVAPVSGITGYINFNGEK